MSITAAKVVAVAATTTAAALGQAEAGKRFVSELKAARKVKVILSAAEQKTFVRLHGFEPIFDQSSTVSHDHGPMYASRMLQVEQVLSALSHEEGEIIAIGCGAFELHRFAGDPRFTLHFEGSEGKDTSRSLRRLAKEARDRWKKGLSSEEKKSLSTEQSANRHRQLAFDAVARFANLADQGSASDVGELDYRKRKFARIVVGSEYETKAQVAVCFDSVYNMGREGIDALLRKGIQVIYGTMFAPYELLYDAAQKHPWYVYREVTGSLGQTVSQVGFSSSIGGYSGGYSHDKEKWSWLLRHPHWSTHGDGLSTGVMAVQSEILSWGGPMLSFKIWKSQTTNAMPRAITLPEWARYVKVLDLAASTDPKTGKVVSKTYFTVSQKGFEGLMTYLFGIKSTDIHALTAVGYIRRHMHGQEMGDKEFEDKWYLEEKNVFPLAVVSAALAFGMKEQMDKVVKSTDNLKKEDSNWHKLVSFLKVSAAVIASVGLVVPAKMLWDWMAHDNLLESIVIRPEYTLWQDGSGLVDTIKEHAFTMDVPTVEISADDMLEDESPVLVDKPDPVVKKPVVEPGKLTADPSGFIPHSDAGKLLGDSAGCYLCDAWRGKLGSQTVRCSHVDDKTAGFDWSMSESEVVEWKNELIEAAKAAPNPLRAAITKAYESMLAGPWNLKSTETELVEAGPGCGKSFGGRLLYSDTVMYYAPFGKLRVDYMQKEVNGEKIDMTFKTTHQGMYYDGPVETLVVDEFTAIDRRAISTVLRKTGAKRVVLMGDRRQTGLLASEGKSILAQSDLSGVSKHELLVNFRNRAWYVALLNLYYGYDMIAAKGGFDPPTYGNLADFAKEATNRVSLNFGHATAQEMYAAEGHTNTVRSNQGSTHAETGIVLGDSDVPHVQNEQLLRVAFSRQTEDLKVYSAPDCKSLPFVKAALHEEDDKLWSPDERIRASYVAKNVGRLLAPLAADLEPGVANLIDHVEVVQAVEKVVEERELVRRFRNQFSYVAVVQDEERATRLVEDHKSRDVFLGKIRADGTPIDSSGWEKKKTDGPQLKFPVLDFKNPKGTKNDVDEDSVCGSDCSFLSSSSWSELDDDLPPSYEETMMTELSRRGELDKKLSMKDLVIPGLGRLVDCVERCVPAGATIVEFFLGTSWCSLVTVLKALGNTVRNAWAFVSWVYKRWSAGAVVNGGVMLSWVEQYIREAGRRVFTLEEVDEHAIVIRGDEGPNSFEMRRMVPIDSDNSTLLVATPGHVDIDAQMTEWMLDTEQEYEVVVPQLGRAERLVKKYYGSFLQVVAKAGLLSTRLRANRGIEAPYEGFEMGVIEVIDAPRGMLYREEGLRSTEALKLTVEEAFYLEAQELGPLPSEVKVESVLPVSTLPEFEYPELPSVVDVKPSWDAYRHMQDFEPLETRDGLRSMNEMAAIEGMKATTRNGKLSADYKDPINKRLRPVDTNGKTARAVGIGSGNWFFAGDRAQCLQSGAFRYLKKERKSGNLTYEGQRLAWKMADEFASECFREQLVVDADAEAEAWNDWIRSARSKNYVGRARAEPEEYKSSVRYFCKNQYKPAKNGKCDHAKVGQGISAWSAQAVAETGGHIRLANLRFLLNLKDNVVYDNKITEEVLAKQVNLLVDELPTGTVSATTDVVEMDSIQDAFTQEIERRILHILGFSDSFVEYYYSFRCNYPIVAQGVFTATGGTEKTSGEPGTLLFNSVLSAVFSNYLVRGYGPFVMVIKGDDNNKWQLGLKVDEVRYSAVKAQSHYRMVISYGQAEFCGKIVTTDGMLPSVNRTLSKLVAQRFGSRQHFYEYQISIRDKVRMMKRIGREKVINATAIVHNITRNQAVSNWDAIESFGHLSYEQYENVSFDVVTTTGIVGMRD